MSTRVLNRSEAIFNKTEEAFKTIGKMCTLLENTRRQPVRVGNAFLNGVTGVNLVMSGNWVFGLTCLTLAGREIYNLSKKPEDPIKILDGVSADVEMIGLLARSREEHLSNIKEKLDAIKTDVMALHTSLDEIRVLNETGVQEIQEHQQRARTLNAKALKTYAKAEELFTEAEDASNEAQAHFDRCALQFAEILELARQPEPDVQVIRKKAAEALVSCNEGRARLNKAENTYGRAFAVFQEAYAFKTKSLAEVMVGTVKAKEIMKASGEKAKSKEQFHLKWNALQKKIGALELDIQEIMLLVADLKEQLREANEAVGQMYDFSAIFVSVAASFAAMQATGLLLPAAAIGLSAGPIWHWSNGAMHTTRCIDQCLFDAPPRPFLRSGTVCLAQFDAISSGKWGAYVQQRPSKTVGNMLLNLDGSVEGGINPAVVRFNLNDRMPVSKLDRLHLFLEITKKIENEKTHPQHALDMLKVLTTPQIIQGSEKTIQVFEKDSFFVRRIEAFCKKKLRK